VFCPKRNTVHCGAFNDHSNKWDIFVLWKWVQPWKALSWGTFAASLNQSNKLPADDKPAFAKLVNL
jgi:hypothetical protein